jgi:hypothetical protein
MTDIAAATLWRVSHSHWTRKKWGLRGQPRGHEARRRGVSLNDRPVPWRPQHRDRIDLGVPRDVLYWTGLWGLTDQELRDAVAAVGSVAADVAAHLGKPLRNEDLSRRGPREG